MTTIDSLKKYYNANKEKALQEYFTLLKFQSVSTDDAYKGELTNCVEWLRKYLLDLGFDVELWETKYQPVLFASYLKAGPDKPTLLIYNHYDVQPVDPIDLWESPPFEPTIRDGEVYARGAQDNKGQLFYVLQALKGILERDKQFPINIKLCIEGDEESGREALSAILPGKKEKLKADYLAIVDSGIYAPDAPSVTVGVRGIITMDVDVVGSNTDLHSGTNGGLVYNPLHALVEVLAKLRDSNGKVTIPGFYDDIVEASNKHLLNLHLDVKQFEETFGAKTTGGEQGISPMERIGLRPTIEINGISGGYSGQGFKTVIPAVANAKVSCRLVANQDPEKIKKIVKNFIESNAPGGVSIKVTIHEGGGRPVLSAPDSTVVKAFAKAYEEIFQKPCQYTLMGGSIPISTELAKASGAELAFLGLGLITDKIHAPNEHFGLDRLEKGYLLITKAIENLVFFP